MEIMLKTNSLDRLIKAFKAPINVEVGIFGENSNREAKGPTNAEIGLKHEFGEDDMPARSFLRAPLDYEFEKRLKKSGMLRRENLKRIVKEKSADVIANEIGKLSVEIILDAFRSGGPKDDPWPPSDFSRKKVHQTLVETQQLRDSVTARVA